MDSEKIIEIANDAKNKSNKDLFLAIEKLTEEFEKTKTLIIDLTRHLESIENLHNNVSKELSKRTKK
jgi:galactitol-specific phosphotransferase system IIB component